MRRFFDIKYWQWWHVILFTTICYPLGSVLARYSFDIEISVEFVVTMGIAGAVIGLIIGGLVEFVRRDKAKTERQEFEKQKQDESL